MTPDPDRARRRFVAFAAASLLYTVAVAVFGAYVRASSSGDGCGAHWPLCNGVVVPVAPSTKTLIELTHRVTSALCGVIAIAVVVAARRAFPRGHAARTAAWLSLVLVITEGLVGAGLVLLEYVAGSRELARGWWMAAHLVNTFALLGAMTLTVLFAAGVRAPGRPRDAIAWLACGGLVLVLLTGTSGAIAALGDTLFPASSLAEGVAAELSPVAHAFVRMRVLHPIVAIGTAAALLLLAGMVLGGAPRAGAQEGALVRRAAHGLRALVLAQTAAGFVNVALLAPIWLQLVHLLVAYAVWITLVVLAAAALAREGASADLHAADVEPARA